MKAKIILPVLMVFFLACTNNKPLTETDKQKITDEVKLVTDRMIKAAEEVDVETFKSLIYDSPDWMILTPNGKKITYKEFIEQITQVFGMFKSQEITTIAEHYRVLDRQTVLYTNVSKTQVNFNDSSIIMQNPWTMFFLMKKIDNEWKWIDGTEYGHEEIIKPAPLPKDLNQLELANQILGRWRTEYGDTVFIFDKKPFGKAKVVTMQRIIKGKLKGEVMQLWGFDQKHNAITYMNAGNNGSSGVLSLKFTSPTTYTAIPYINISNPAYAPLRIEGEFIDKDTFVEKIIQNNETKRIVTVRRVK